MEIEMEDDANETGLQLKTPPVDLLDMISRVRSLHYTSAATFVDDLRSFRRIVSHKLNCNGSADSHSSERIILDSFDTLIDITERFMERNAGPIMLLERRIRENQEEEAKKTERSQHKRRSTDSNFSSTSTETLEDEKDSPILLLSPNDHMTNGHVDATNNEMKSTTSSQPQSKPTTFISSEGLEKYMIENWRSECDRNYTEVVDIVSNAATSPVKCSMSKSEVWKWIETTSRSKEEWAIWLDQGTLMEDADYPHVSFNAKGFKRDENIVTLGKGSNGTTHMDLQATLKQNMLPILDVSSMLHDVDAAKMMLGMRDSQLRETVSLKECIGNNTLGFNGNVGGQYQVSDRFTDRFILNDAQEGGLADDEMLVSIDRLQQTAQRMLFLGASVRRQHMEQQRQLLCNDTAALSIGEGKLLVELKAANDNLRWRLRQRLHALSTAQKAMATLWEHTEKMELRAVAAEQEVKTLRKKMEKLEKLEIVNSSSKDNTML